MALVAAGLFGGGAVAQADPEAAVAGASGGQIVLQGAVNVRDMGGFRTYDGATTKSGKVIRADALGKLTDADVAKLGTLKIQSVVDYRTQAEIAGLGADRLPAGVPLVSRAIEDGGMFAKMYQAIQSKDPVKQQELLGDGKAEQIMGDMYRNFFTADAMAKFGQTVKDLAATGTVTLFHCTAGKDRTGWTAYVVLRAVGVPESIARQDYLKSNEYRAAADAALRAQLKQGGIMQNPDLLIPLQEVREAYLDIAVDQVTQKYGDFGKFLTNGLGLDGATILKLRKNLVS
ncbi:tyrosine-protein phosphatase [Nocardia yamanashiensis]|uniref:tyrosine-protein phosphatase n=1 Tax=Nocardia yamanashiensis TaxID=209247 RepID=UPI001E5FE680|nr:tyrosine-protein phosphatase [Nocardia yamanashiensis]UGT45064.1 tyrosine-protein phosphatase [Nocardia yamanashiensis]